jgi:hypothetical protein
MRRRLGSSASPGEPYELLTMTDRSSILSQEIPSVL